MLREEFPEQASGIDRRRRFLQEGKRGPARPGMPHAGHRDQYYFGILCAAGVALLRDACGEGLGERRLAARVALRPVGRPGLRRRRARCGGFDRDIEGDICQPIRDPTGLAIGSVAEK